MKGMILAAGLGTRLQHITRDKPKCLVEVDGKPILLHVVEQLKKAGVRELVINLHYLGDQIRKYVSDHNSFGLRVIFSEEPEILGTGGGVAKCADILSGEDPVIVHNGDIYSEIDLEAMVRSHRSINANASLLVMARESNRRLLFDSQNSLCGWENLKSGSRQLIREEMQASISLAFSGIQIIDQKIISELRAFTGEFSIIDGYFAAVRRGLSVKGLDVGTAYWADMGSPEKLSDLNKYLTAQKIQ